MALAQHDTLNREVIMYSYHDTMEIYDMLYLFCFIFVTLFKIAVKT